MGINFKTIDNIAKYAESQGVKSLLQTKPAEFGNINPDGLKVLKKDICNIQSNHLLLPAKNKKEINEFTYFMADAAVKQELNSFLLHRQPSDKTIKMLCKACKVYTDILLIFHPMKTEIIRNSTKQIIGGFGYELKKSKMHIMAMGISEEMRKTKEGHKFLINIAKRIKQIAAENNITKITCESSPQQKHITKLYKRIGFNLEKATKYKNQYSVTTENFGNGYF